MDLFSFKVKGKIFKDYSLKNLNWFKVGGQADYFFSPVDEEDLANFLVQKPADIPINIIGAGSNILISDHRVKVLLLNFLISMTYTFVQKEHNHAGSGVMNLSVANIAIAGVNDNNQKKYIGGFEFLSGIPGSICGAIAMNAGAFGREFKDICTSVRYMKMDGSIIEVQNHAMGFSYRENSLLEPVIFFVIKNARLQ